MTLPLADRLSSPNVSHTPIHPELSSNDDSSSVETSYQEVNEHLAIKWTPFLTLAQFAFHSADPYLVDYHLRLGNAVRDWGTSFATTGKYDFTKLDEVELLITGFNLRLTELNEVNRIWFDYDERQRINNLARRRHLRQ